MKKGLKIILIIFVGIILVLTTSFAVSYYYIRTKNMMIENKSSKIETKLSNKEEYMKLTKRAVVIKVGEKYLDVMGFEGTHDLYDVSYEEEGNIGFKKGQEILIYYDGMVLESYPAQIRNVGKIEIIKEESDIQIPDEVLKFYYKWRWRFVK